MAVRLVLAGLILSSTASARVVDGVTLSQDEIQRREVLLDSYNAHFHPELTESVSHLSHEDHERGACLTGLVRELKDSWHLFDAAERSEITSQLAPWKVDLLDEFAPAVPPPSGSCWGQQKDNVLETEHFSIQWDDGIITSATAEDFAEALEYSWEVEIDELGWRPPAGTSTYQMLVQVENMGGGAGAYTTVERCGSFYAPYVVASANSFHTGSWYKTMACHELHHAVQYAYGFAHEFWYWEASATWVEDLVYPDLNDWTDAVYVYSLVPYMGMNAFRGSSGDEYLFYHTYAMGIWGMFLDQHVGGNELVRETWEASRTSTCQYCLWIPDAVDRAGEDFVDLYTRFIATNAVMDYNDRLWLATPTLSDEVGTLPASGESDYQDRPQSLGQNFIRFDDSLGGSGKALEVTFDGENTPDEWVAVLVRGDTEVEEMVVFALNENMWGTAQIDFPGDTNIHLVVSPIDESAQGYYYDWSNADDYDYSWSAQIVGSDSSGGDDEETGGEDGGSANFADGDKSGEVIGKNSSACTCSASSGRSAGWLVLLLGIVPAIRRRS